MNESKKPFFKMNSRLDQLLIPTDVVVHFIRYPILRVPMYAFAPVSSSSGVT